MSNVLSWGLGVSLAAGGVWGFLGGFRQLRVHQLVRDTPTAKARSMAMGLVELNGVSEARSQVTAPFSARPCVYWQVDISVPGSKRRRGWRVVHRAASGNPFYLRDTTGVALVHPHGAECRLPFGLEEEVMSLLHMPALYRDFMAAQNLPLRHLWQLGPMRFRERILQEGQGLYVLGRAHPKAQAVTLSDGESDLELQATGTDAWRARRLASVDREIQGVIRKGSGSDLLILSLASEKGVELEYAIRGWAGVVLGPLACIGGIALLIELFRHT